MLQRWLQRWREARARRALIRLDVPFEPPVDRPWTKDDVGWLGEQLAALHLSQEGCKVLYQNYRCPEGGEADLVLRDRNALVFVEVKTRSNRDPVHRPRDAVDREKRDLIRRASRSWRSLLEIRPGYRYDIVEVLLQRGERPQVNWVRGAFEEQE
jgi:putative endonuclease